jgi:GLPGLI family protein
MKAFLQILFFCFISNLSFSQESNFEAIYKVKYIPVNFDSISKINGVKKKKSVYNKKEYDIGKTLKIGGENLKKIKFSLEFNKKQSVFYKLPVLDNDAKKTQLISLVFGILDQKYFVNSKERIIQKNSYGQDFLVEMPKIKWNITREHKKIGKYMCYKATTQIEKENPKRRFKLNIVAWFAPEISFSYGPKYYSGLPGLIVELKEGKNIVYQLEKIKKDKYKKIKLPKKGKKITSQEFDLLSKKMYKGLKSN